MKAFFKPASAGLASINRVELACKALALAMSSLLGLWHTAAFPQAYPAKPIRLFVSTGPGAPPDVMARLLGEKLALSLGQPVLVENRPGASGSIGMNAVAKAAPDGHTLGIFSMGYTTAPSMLAQMPYDTERDLAPVTMLARYAAWEATMPRIPDDAHSGMPYGKSELALPGSV